MMTFRVEQLLKTLVRFLLGFCLLSGPLFAAESPEDPVAFYSDTGEVIQRSLTASGQVTNVVPYAADQLIVKFKEAASPARRAAANQRLGARTLKNFNHVRNLEVVQLPSGLNVEQAVQSYRGHPDVLYAEPNYRVESLGLPNDPSFTAQWNLRNTGQNGGTAGGDVKAVQAWDITTGSSNVVVAVIDSGVDYNHQDLAGNMWRNEADCNHDGIDNDGDGYIDDCYGIDTANGDSDPMDDNDHGTHVTGIIGAVGNNNTGVTGLNWSVKILSCKFISADGTGYLSDAIACLDYVKTMKDRGVNIVATNNSWGGRGFSQALYDAIEAQRQSGILFIAAAGNGFLYRDDDEMPVYPASYNLSNVIAVTATEETDSLTGYSHFGKASIHLGAPGQNILSTVRGNAYAVFSGTSMAAPHVAGLAALLKAQVFGRDWRTIKNLILAGGDSKSSLSGFTITGRRMNAQRSLGCSNSTVLGRLWPRSKQLTIGMRPLKLSALHINCGNPNGNVVVSVGPGNSSVVLADDGVGADEVAGDGVYWGQWTPPAGGVYTLTYPDGDVLTVTVDKDLKPGFPVQVFHGPGSYMAGPANHTLVGNIDHDSNLEILVTALAPGPLYAFKSDGSLVPGWPLADNFGAEYAGLGELAGSSQAFDVFSGFFGLQGIIGGYSGSGSRLPGWPRSADITTTTPPSLADIDGDGIDEIFIDEYDNSIHAYRADGTILPGWPSARAPFAGQRRYTPAIADLDGDGKPEIISGTDPSCGGVCYYYIAGEHTDGRPVDGFPILWTPGLYGYVALGDVDGDGTPEIVAVGWDTDISVLVFSADGKLKRSIPLGFHDSSTGTAPALADLDGDGIPEIIVQTDSAITVLRGDGSTYPGWPVFPGEAGGYSSPVVGDVDGDGLPDIVVTTVFRDATAQLGSARAYNRNGTLLPGFPKKLPTGLGAVPAIADIDGDGRNEIIVTSVFWNGVPGDYDKVWVYDLGGPPHGAIQWGQYMEGPKHHGFFKGGYDVPKKYTVNINKVGPGNGIVNGSGILCGVTTCSGTYSPGDEVVLSATADSGSIFHDWSGSGCAGGGVCAVTVNSDVWLDARFDGIYTLQIVKTGGGGGLVETYQAADINCGMVCSATYKPGTTLMLIATPELGSNFVGWSGGQCVTVGFTCTITINSNTQISAGFVSIPNLHVTVADPDGGDVVVGGTTICEKDCTIKLTYGIDTSLQPVNVTLGFVFTGWSGDCNGMMSCTLQMTADKRVTANFSRPLGFPNSIGGQIWQMRTKRAIQWTHVPVAELNMSKVNIDISRDGGLTWKSIAKKSPNDGTQLWKVNGPATSQAKIRICGNPYSQYCAVSDTFTIQ